VAVKTYLVQLSAETQTTAKLAKQDVLLDHHKPQILQACAIKSSVRTRIYKAELTCMDISRSDCLKANLIALAIFTTPSPKNQILLIAHEQGPGVIAWVFAAKTDHPKLARTEDEEPVRGDWDASSDQDSSSEEDLLVSAPVLRGSPCTSPAQALQSLLSATAQLLGRKLRRSMREFERGGMYRVVGGADVSAGVFDELEAEALDDGSTTGSGYGERVLR
jgi:hypothetical protein